LVRHNAEYAGIGQIEAEHQLAGIFRLASTKASLRIRFPNIVGADVDLDVDRGLLLLRRQRAGSVRILERKVLVYCASTFNWEEGPLLRRAVAVVMGSLLERVLSDGTGFALNSLVS